MGKNESKTLITKKNKKKTFCRNKQKSKVNSCKLKKSRTSFKQEDPTPFANASSAWWTRTQHRKSADRADLEESGSTRRICRQEAWKQSRVHHSKPKTAPAKQDESSWPHATPRTPTATQVAWDWSSWPKVWTTWLDSRSQGQQFGARHWQEHWGLWFCGEEDRAASTRQEEHLPERLENSWCLVSEKKVFFQSPFKQTCKKHQRKKMKVCLIRNFFPPHM